MAGVVKGMDATLKSMNLEKVEQPNMKYCDLFLLIKN